MTVENTIITLFRGKDVNTAATSKKILQQIIADNKALIKVQQGVANSGGRIATMTDAIADSQKNNAFKLYMKDFGKLQESYGKMPEALSGTNSAIKKAEGGWNNFFTSFQAGFMSMMFGGMQLQRIMNGLIKGMISNFKELSVATDPTRIALTRLEGSIKFLKFQLVEASGPLIQQFSGFITDLANRLAMTDPNKLELLAKGIGAMWVLGFALFNLGQMGLFITGITSLVNSLSSAATGTAVSNASNLAKGLKGLGGGVAVTLGLVSISKGAYDLSQGEVQSAITNFAQGIVELSAGALIFNGKGKAGGALLALSVVLQLEQERASFFDRGVIEQMISDVGYLTGTIGGLFEMLWWKIEDTFRSSLVGKLLGLEPMEGTAGKAFTDALSKSLDVSDRAADSFALWAGRLELQRDQQKLLTGTTADYIGKIDEQIVQYPELFAFSDTQVEKLTAEETAARKAKEEYIKLAEAKKDAAGNNGSYSSSGYSGETNMSYTG